MDFMEALAVADLSKVGERIKLKPKAGDEPHWQRLRVGCFLGYRPSRLGGKGNWFARAFDHDAAKYKRRQLGGYGDLAGNEIFAVAKRDAELWCDRVETGAVAGEKLETVADERLERMHPVAIEFVEERFRARLKAVQEGLDEAGIDEAFLRKHLFDPIEIFGSEAVVARILSSRGKASDRFWVNE